MRERMMQGKPVTCSHCGLLPTVFILYDEGGRQYCPRCAYAYGAITEDQYREDCEDNDEMRRLFLEKKNG